MLRIRSRLSKVLRSLAGVVLVASVAGACTPPDKVPLATFAGPSGLAVAGSKWDHLFIANTSEDTVQVIKLTAALKDLDFVPSATRYFPLRIPAGPSPAEVAATFDGRFVLVLDIITSSIRLINTDTFTSDPNSDTALRPLGVQVGAMVGSALACPTAPVADANCIGRAYVALPSVGMIAAVDVVQDASGVASVKVAQYLAVGGTPTRLAVHPADRNALFATDALAPDVIRVDLATGKASRTFIGAPGGALALSPDGTMLLVARPELHDVLVLTNAAGTSIAANDALAAFDANTSMTPRPACVPSCSDASLTTCSRAHPADQELCSTGNGYDSGLISPYRGLYFDGIPAQIATFGGAERPMKVTCAKADRSTEDRLFSQAAAVVTLDGVVTLVGLRRQDAPDAPSPEIVDLGYCQHPELTHLQAASVDSVLDPCPTAPAGRKRFFCATEPGGTGGVLGLPGRSRAQDWRFTWEGYLPQLDRGNGGGKLSADGTTFGDSNLDLANAGIETAAMLHAGQHVRGDILEIITRPSTGDPTCQAALPNATRRCVLERRIVDLRNGQLVLDRPLPTACFASGQNIEYRVRFGDAFLVTTGAEAPVRLRSGDLYGPGFVNGANQGVSFRVNSTLHVHDDADPCARYQEDGSPGVEGMEAVLTRDNVVEFRLNDPYTLAQTGIDIDPQTNSIIGPVGRMPGGAVVTRSGDQLTPMLFVSYGASDSVLATIPFDPANMMSQNNNKVLR